MASSFRGLSLAVGAVFALAFAGCSDYTSPAGVLGTAFSALQKEKVKAFKRTLTGEAAEQYGNLVGMGDLAAEIRGLDLTVGTVTKTNAVTDFRGREIFQEYDVKVLARDKVTQVASDEVSTGTFRLFKNAKVECRIQYVRVWNDPLCDVPGPIVRCGGGFPRYYTVEKQTTCLIAGLAAPTLD